ncbi:hypothetical protein WS86_13405 [Burkholderia savannae]|uniref:DUF2306 domain-containing protein n=1 Tax=Burkholderia savannae TaxID=1637837 RepID=UPI0007563461|nr:DUF2306 domain-containing protein [Burkholderia savannae]AOJ81505.1 hypothetical protein WS86_13405 [Burkholderia savannae]
MAQAESSRQAPASSTGEAASNLGRFLSLAFLLGLLTVMAAFGWVTLQEGTHRFLLPFTSANATQQATDAVASIRAHPSPEGARKFSEEVWMLSLPTSVKRFGDSRLMEQGIYYTTMPRANQVLIAMHVLFSAFCVTFGSLQFWPSFRKRFMLAHRLIGTVYVATVPISSLTALAYLALTPPHHIYAHLVGWIALWIFGVLTLVAIAMAMRALKARRLFEHQAWMALSFGCLLVAPLLRIDWVLLVPLFPSIDQETLNLVTMGFMLPQCLLIAYALTLVNRQYARPMKKRAPAAWANRASAWFLRSQPLLLASTAAWGAVNVWAFGLGHGTAGIDAAARMLPADLLTREHAVLHAYPGIAWLMALSLTAAFPAAVLSLGTRLRAGPASVAARLDAATALLGCAAGATAAFVGWRIGLAPDSRLLSGGAMYLVNGLVIAGFSLMLAATARRRQDALAKESLVFLLSMLPFPTLYFATLQAVDWIRLPADYLAAGQGFVIPVGFSGGLLFLAAFHVIFGQATREHN